MDDAIDPISTKGRRMSDCVGKSAEAFGFVGRSSSRHEAKEPPTALLLPYRRHRIKNDTSWLSPLESKCTATLSEWSRALLLTTTLLCLSLIKKKAPTIVVYHTMASTTCIYFIMCSSMYIWLFIHCNSPTYNRGELNVERYQSTDAS